MYGTARDILLYTASLDWFRAVLEWVTCLIHSSVIFGSSLGKSKYRDPTIWAWYWHSTLPVRLFLNTTLCRAPVGVRASWAPSRLGNWPVMLGPQAEEVQTLTAAFWILVVVVGTSTRLGILLSSHPAQLHLSTWEPAFLNLQLLGALQGVQLLPKRLGTQLIHHTLVWGGSLKHPLLWIPSGELYTSGGLGLYHTSWCLAHRTDWHSAVGPWLVPVSVLFSSPRCPMCSGNPYVTRSPCGPEHWGWVEGSTSPTPDLGLLAAWSLPPASWLVPEPWSHQVPLCTPGKWTGILATSWVSSIFPMYALWIALPTCVKVTLISLLC